ncbi:MAG: lipase family protein [Moorea sp. SIO2B7]|nr:lipase family protein [Moorena sp. SIO2B7]
MVTVTFNELLDYALRSQLAYSISQPGWYITEKLGWRKSSLYRLTIKEVPESEVNILIEFDDSKQTQCIVIRGSSNLENWLLNFQYIQRPLTGKHPILENLFSKLMIILAFQDTRESSWCQNEMLPVTENNKSNKICIDLHTGFHKAAEDVYEAIFPHLKKDYKTRLTGHSLGGAIAVILMILLKEKGYHIEKCITFGQPKVTDTKGAQTCKDLPLIRVINDEDLVPLLPPSTILTILQGGYEHFGSEITLQKGKYTYTQEHKGKGNHEHGFWANLFEAVARKHITESTDNIEDHNLNLYLFNILSNMQSQYPDLKSFLPDLNS